MSLIIDMCRSSRVTSDPLGILWHYVRGEMVDFVDTQTQTEICWRATSHRGLQWLDKVEFPRKQKRYIFSPAFEIRHNTDFEGVMRGCAFRKDGGRSWVTGPFIEGMIELHKMGFAHSYEAWSEGKLVGGAFGVQLGSMISCDSMFHTVSNASKAAYGQTLVHLQKRGFKVVDTNGVASHQVNYGEEWMPEWQYHRLIYQCLSEPAPSLVEGRPYPGLPWQLKAMLPVLKVGRKVIGKLPFKKKGPPAAGAGGGGGATEAGTGGGEKKKEEGEETQARVGAVA